MRLINRIKNKLKLKVIKHYKIVLYFLRWQLAGIIIYPVSIWLCGNFWGVVFGNTWGCILFYFIDRYLLTTRNEDKVKERRK